ncbi:GlxA family transcriptional regulator [Burkholderia thailandensis]|uniref:GlxA family transcriptional regulator n=1 Tax=Burkholderia thailandensis TaxID=57975 RepID=UPI00016A4ACB|nr:helix-turn-helix domain-containing protein [Burkholderia thailandensis]AHI67126.1 helix-turn-helix domain protein [Burkholderia thailandensis H0587]AIP66001.1 AraC family transcriptional regulator [Burkholderia thailandensis]AJY31973.1 helix-turn-helix domain protein [Burkholderia thailandensis 34]AOI55689.1 AraC family transcriptional regulator [Burkholderia thailandensis]AOJ54655.1 AraC family transcriptional regulator [Burkholderia thailandensis]
MHSVGVLVLNGVVPFDLGVACDTFARVRVPNVDAPYRVRVCGERRRARGDLFDVRTAFGLDGLRDADTVVVPGVADPLAPVSPRVVAALREAASRGCRIASICSGAFVLAQAGLLDGLRATTHWLGAAELARRYPHVSVDANVLFIDNGQVLTSAGASAGLDLCLHMIRCDYGAAAAADAARLAVTPLVRDGGQAQFIAGEPPQRTSTLRALMEWLQRNLREPLTLDAIARQSAMSVRTLTRRFQEQTGTSPLQWLQTARVRRAQQLLETTSLSVEQIATEAGFGSASAFRERFARIVGTSPKRYRQAFRMQSD